jgi:hypothetical protein
VFFIYIQRHHLLAARGPVCLYKSSRRRRSMEEAVKESHNQAARGSHQDGGQNQTQRLLLLHSYQSIYRNIKHYLSKLTLK